MEHLRGLTVIKANDSEYRHGIQNDMGDIVADVAGFTNGREIATLFSVAPDLLAACQASYDLLVSWHPQHPDDYRKKQAVIKRLSEVLK